MANPDLARLITEAIGDGWITDMNHLRELLPLAEDGEARAQILRTKQVAKERFAAWLKATTGQVVDPETIFDSQAKSCPVLEAAE